MSHVRTVQLCLFHWNSSHARKQIRKVEHRTEHTTEACGGVNFNQKHRGRPLQTEVHRYNRVEENITGETLYRLRIIKQIVRLDALNGNNE